MIRFRGTVVVSPKVRALSHRMRNTVADGASPTDVVLDMLDLCPDRELPALIVSLLGHTRRSAGRPTVPLTLTDAERRAAHARHAQGATDEATRQGEREYQRAHKRASRERQQPVDKSLPFAPRAAGPSRASPTASASTLRPGSDRQPDNPGRG